MTPFASVDQYVERFGTVSDRAMLEACLEDATAAISSELDSHDINYTDPSESFSDRLMRVCRSMANRIMPADSGDIPVGATQISETTGPYNVQYTLGITYGTPKLLPSERQMLGLGVRVRFSPPAGPQ